jgi:hypothetical protein
MGARRQRTTAACARVSPCTTWVARRALLLLRPPARAHSRSCTPPAGRIGAGQGAHSGGARVSCGVRVRRATDNGGALHHRWASADARLTAGVALHRRGVLRAPRAHIGHVSVRLGGTMNARSAPAALVAPAVRRNFSLSSVLPVLQEGVKVIVQVGSQCCACACTYLVTRSSLAHLLLTHTCVHVPVSVAPVLAQDDFSRCFMSTPVERWDWNAYLCVLWYMGLVFRHCVLFPLRFAAARPPPKPARPSQLASADDELARPSSAGWPLW